MPITKLPTLTDSDYFSEKESKQNHPKEVSMDKLTDWTNAKVVIRNAGLGGKKY